MKTELIEELEESLYQTRNTLESGEKNQWNVNACILENQIVIMKVLSEILSPKPTVSIIWDGE